MDDTQLAQALHGLARDLAAAKGARDAARLKELLVEFDAAAAVYRSHATADERFALFINQVHDSVVGILEDIAGAAGGVVSKAIKPLLWPIVVLAIVVVVVLFVWKRYAR